MGGHPAADRGNLAQGATCSADAEGRTSMFQQPPLKLVPTF